MESTSELRDVIHSAPADATYYDRVRAEILTRGEEIEELRVFLAELTDPIQKATVHDLIGERPAAVDLLAAQTEQADAVALAARLLLEEGQSARAIQLLEPALAKHGSNPAIQGYMVEARGLSGDTDGARAALASAGLPEDSPLSRYLHGVITEREGEYATALEHYEAAAEGEPGETRFQFRLGYLHSLHGDEERAVKAYEMCQRTAPVYARAMINLGILYEDLERYDDAITCYRMVLQAAPTHERARLYLDDAEASLDMYYDREKEKERSRRNQLLQLPVTDFELSVRSRNCLAKMNIHTLGDLIHKTEAELLSYKNFGETSLAEIKRILHQKGLRLGMGDDRADSNVLPDGEQNKMYGEPVSVLELSSRSQRCMDRLGIETLGDLMKRSELELISQKNFGVTSLNEVKRKLSERGLGLANS